MRSRSIVLIVAMLLVAGFAALNWSEISRPAPLLFGPVVVDAPMGLILLGLLVLGTMAFVVIAGSIRTQSLVESRTFHKSLEAQRELADKAEASRFTDLRQQLDTQLRELRESDSRAIGEFQKSMVLGQKELRTQLEQINRTLAARLSEMESRLDTRFERMPGYAPGAVSVPSTMRADHVQATADRHEAAQELELREARLRDEHARADQRTVADVQPRADDRIVPAGERPAESGWRRWF